MHRISPSAVKLREQQNQEHTIGATLSRTENQHMDSGEDWYTRRKMHLRTN